MPALREVQAAFRRAILEGDDAAAAAMVAGDGIAPEARLGIYRHHVLTTLTAALKATYPVVCRLVDERFFDYAADRYIRDRPPTAPCLFEYGDEFPAFLAEFEPCRHIAYLPDVARLEWALNVATHADEAAAIDPEELVAVPPEAYPRLVFRFDPSVHLLSSSWPIDRIWRANQPDADADVAVTLGAGGVALEVRRIRDVAGFRSLDAPTYAFRRALSQGRSLEAAVIDALEADPEFDLTGALRSLLADRVVTGFIVAAAGDRQGD